MTEFFFLRENLKVVYIFPDYLVPFKTVEAKLINFHHDEHKREKKNMVAYSPENTLLSLLPLIIIVGKGEKRLLVEKYKLHTFFSFFFLTSCSTHFLFPRAHSLKKHF